MQQLLEFVKPELMILVPFLMFLGIVIKKTSFCKDRYIPLTLGIIGIFMSALYIISTTALQDAKDIMQAVFTALTQGVVSAGVSVYFHQLKKQHASNKPDETNDNSQNI